MASPYKMKNSMLKMAAKGAPMQKNYGSPLHEETEAEKKARREKAAKEIQDGMKNMSKTELQEVAQRNIEKGVTFQGLKNIKPGVDSRTDSVRSSISHLRNIKKN